MTQPTTNGDLIFIFRGKTEVIKKDLPKALLYFLKKKHSKDAQYSGGELKVELYKDKKEIEVKKISKYQEYLNEH
jgi:hypothetical protein